LLVGYCEPNSLGGKLKRGNKEVTLFGDVFFVNAEIKEMRSMSAHGDYEDLCQFIACQDTEKVKKMFLVHGEYDVQEVFRSRLIKKGFGDVEVPAQHQSFEL
jgi:metallo-beta-lactamase family protein